MKKDLFMRIILALLVVLAAVLQFGIAATSANTQRASCNNFDTQAEAQAAFDSPDADAMALALDLDRDGIACPDLALGKERSVPAVDALPDDLTRAEVVEIVDGDTLKVRIEEGDDEGQVQTVRLIGIDTPETRDPDECFGAAATKRLETMLPDGRTVYLEQDISDTDRYNRKLRYVWFSGKKDGEPYLANEILVREGFAVVSTFPPDLAHIHLLIHAQDVATFRNAGLWGACGGVSSPQETPTQAAPTPAVAPTPPPAPTQPPAPTAAPLITYCAAFGSFNEANAYYMANPAAQPYLDPNFDGRACEIFFGVDQPAPPPPAAPPTTGGGSGAPIYTDFGGLDGVDYDCYDFGDDQAAAQAYFERDGGSVYNNADGLDRNHNGLACEPGEFN